MVLRKEKQQKESLVVSDAVSLESLGMFAWCVTNTGEKGWRRGRRQGRPEEEGVEEEQHQERDVMRCDTGANSTGTIR